MNTLIHAGLERQRKALELLADLLREEFELLLVRNTDEIAQLEFSIHELLRQLLTEKQFIARMLRGERARDYAARLPETQEAEQTALLRDLDELEQVCARQATRNTEISLGLLDQSRLLLRAVHEKLSPKTGDLYGKRGAMNAVRRPEAALLAGRL